MAEKPVAAVGLVGAVEPAGVGRVFEVVIGSVNFISDQFYRLAANLCVGQII